MRRHSLITAWLFVAAAHAGVPVVFDGGSAAEVVEFAASRTGLPASQFEPVGLDTVLGALPTPLGAAAIRHCAGASTRAADLRAQAIRAESAWRDGDLAAAMDELDLGIAGLGCLSERVDAPVAAHLFLLRGGMLARQGYLEGARAELRSALSMGAATTWDDTLPPEGRPLFDEMCAETVRATLVVAPSDSGAAPWIDGRAATGEPLPLRPGLHLVQVPSTSGLRSAWLTVDGDATLVVPGNFRRPVLERLATTPGEVEALVRATVSQDAVYVASQGGLWLLAMQDGQPNTTMLVAPPPPVEEPEPRKRRKRH